MIEFSIVTAVYNVEKYLNDYFKSIVKQKLSFQENIEIILVDDGSTDNSGKICRSWQKKYPNNIKYFYKENGGVSSARNLGLNYIQGKYVSFIDPDDFINPIYFKRMLETSKQYPDADLLIARVFLYYEKNKTIKQHPLTFQTHRNPTDIYFDFYSKGCTFIQQSSCYICLKSEIIKSNNLCFYGRYKVF